MNISDERSRPRLKLAPGWTAGDPRLLDGTEAKSIPPYGIAEIELRRGAK